MPVTATALDRRSRRTGGPTDRRSHPTGGLTGTGQADGVLGDREGGNERRAVGPSRSGDRTDRTGAPIRHTTFATPLGRALVAVSGVGVVALRLGDDDERLEAELAALLGRGRAPTGSRRDDAGLTDLRRAVLAQLVGDDTDPGGAGRHVPLDLRGTPFQRSVWEALRAIPRGETRTYAEVAAAVGRPRAVRAVGGACGANPVAVLVPCHRVVATGGGLGGYAGGLERKRALLALEGVPLHRHRGQGASIGR
jgi:O-6-methylguanine DNA methyltransferase